MKFFSVILSKVIVLNFPGFWRIAFSINFVVNAEVLAFIFFIITVPDFLSVSVTIPIKYYESLIEAVEDLHSQGMNIVGTTSHTKRDFYDLDLHDGNNVIVFGTESKGFTKLKMSYLDDVVKLPMGEGIDFLTLPVATSAIAYEINRQYR